MASPLFSFSLFLASLLPTHSLPLPLSLARNIISRPCRPLPGAVQSISNPTTHALRLLACVACCTFSLSYHLGVFSQCYRCGGTGRPWGSAVPANQRRRVVTVSPTARNYGGFSWRRRVRCAGCEEAALRHAQVRTNARFVRPSCVHMFVCTFVSTHVRARESRRLR